MRKDPPNRAQVTPGPHHGDLVLIASERVEVCIVDDGAVPRFRLFFFDLRNQPAALPTTPVTLEIARDSGKREAFAFRRGRGFLESTSPVEGPREFEVILNIEHTGSSENHVHRVRFHYAPR